MKISVLIVTRNRGNTLEKCLQSLLIQSIKPFEVIIVDNNSTDNTKAIAKKYQKKLNILYFFESKIGIPFARNTSLSHVSGDVCAFVDDDCILTKEWMKSICDFFNNHLNAVGSVGKTFSLNQNIYSMVEYLYYLRWISENTQNKKQPSALKSGYLIDFKNSAFRTKFIQNFKFSTDVPFGDVGDEDVEIGYRMFQKNRSIFFNPKQNVYHLYSSSLSRLLIRNFWNGYSNSMLKDEKKISLPKHQVSVRSFYIDLSRREQKRFNYQLFFLLTIYPFFSKLGKLTAEVAYLLHWDLLPRRK